MLSSPECVRLVLGGSLSVALEPGAIVGGGYTTMR